MEEEHAPCFNQLARLCIGIHVKPESLQTAQRSLQRHKPALAPKQTKDPQPQRNGGLALLSCSRRNASAAPP